MPYVPTWHGQARPHLASYMVVALRYLYFRKLYYRVISARSIRARLGFSAETVAGWRPVSYIRRHPVSTRI